MPTINQLVRNPRKAKKAKSKSPALQTAFNSLKNRVVKNAAPLKRGVPLYVNLLK